MDNIEFNEKRGTYSFVEANRREVAWHRLGKRYDCDGITSWQALRDCNADFQVEKQPILALTPQMQAMIANGEMISPDELKKAIINGKCATMRLDTNTPLGLVSSNYGIVQNADAFKFIDQFVGGDLTGTKFNPIIDAAGILGKGERIFVTAKFPEPIKLDNSGDDVVDMYVVFTTSHDGTGAVNAMITPVRVVCNNTLNLALTHNSGKLSLRHTSNVNNRLDLTNAENAEFAYKTLNLYNLYKEQFESEVQRLQKIVVSDEQAQDILARTFLPSVQYDFFKNEGIDSEGISGKSRTQLQAATKALYDGVGQDFGKSNNGLWLLNGISSLYQNHANISATTDETKFFDCVTDGKAYKALNEAMTLIYALQSVNA